MTKAQEPVISFIRSEIMGSFFKLGLYDLLIGAKFDAPRNHGTPATRAYERGWYYAWVRREAGL